MPSRANIRMKRKRRNRRERMERMELRRETTRFLRDDQYLKKSKKVLLISYYSYLLCHFEYPE